MSCCGMTRRKKLNDIFRRFKKYYNLNGTGWPLELSLEEVGCLCESMFGKDGPYSRRCKHRVHGWCHECSIDSLIDDMKQRLNPAKIMKLEINDSLYVHWWPWVNVLDDGNCVFALGKNTDDIGKRDGPNTRLYFCESLDDYLEVYETKLGEFERWTKGAKTGRADKDHLFPALRARVEFKRLNYTIVYKTSDGGSNRYSPGPTRRPNAWPMRLPKPPQADWPRPGSA